MVKEKYCALYTDNLGCEQAEVYFLKWGLQLKVRNCIFRNDNFNFDFYANNPDEIKKSFYLKDNELIEYIIDIKLPLVLTYNNKECVRKFLLRIERHKNYYSNSLSMYSNGIVYRVKGYNFMELLNNMKKELPKEYDMEYSSSCILGMDYTNSKNENISCCFKNSKNDKKPVSIKRIHLDLLNKQHQKYMKNLKRIPITYMSKRCCLN